MELLGLDAIVDGPLHESLGRMIADKQPVRTA